MGKDKVSCVQLRRQCVFQEGFVSRTFHLRRPEIILFMGAILRRDNAGRIT